MLLPTHMKALKEHLELGELIPGKHTHTRGLK